MMISRNLELFMKVAEYGSITKTAKALYITQPAVSNAIAKLEKELGVSLFSRDKRKGLLLTEVGTQILLLARQMEDADHRIYQTACKSRNLISGRVRIAVLTSLVSTILSGALKTYRARYPGIHIEIKEGTPNDIFTMIEERSADFAVSCSPFGTFDAIPLIRDRIMAIFPADSSAAGPVKLSEPPELLIVNKPAYETILDHATQKDPIKMNNVILVETAETVLRMAADGIGAGIISEYTLKTLAPDYPQYPVLPDIAFDIGIFANNMDDLPPAAAEFVRMIREEDL